MRVAFTTRRASLERLACLTARVHLWDSLPRRRVSCPPSHPAISLRFIHQHSRSGHSLLYPIPDARLDLRSRCAPPPASPSSASRPSPRLLPHLSTRPVSLASLAPPTTVSLPLLVILSWELTSRRCSLRGQARLCVSSARRVPLPSHLGLYRLRHSTIGIDFVPVNTGDKRAKRDCTLGGSAMMLPLKASHHNVCIPSSRQRHSGHREERDGCRPAGQAQRDLCVPSCSTLRRSADDPPRSCWHPWC